MNSCLSYIVLTLVSYLCGLVSWWLNYYSLLKENINYTTVGDLTYSKTTAGEPD